MSPIRIGVALALVLGAPAATAAQPVLLISIDGLRPLEWLDKSPHGEDLPTLQRLLREGAHAARVHRELHTLTYPRHTTLLTGVEPARHGIVNNWPFDPANRNQQGWTWYASDIRVPTLWDAAHAAGMTTANVHWPVSVDARLDYNLPQIWRSGTPDDRKLLHALATPGLLDAMEADLGPYADGIDESIEADENRARFAQWLIERRHPRFMTAYFTAFDHAQHLGGPDAPEAHRVLARIDAAVGRLVAAARRDNPNVVVCVVSDHGFAPLSQQLNLWRVFIDAGLITLAEKNAVASWQAMPWYSGGSAAIALADAQDAGVRTRVANLLQGLRSDPANAIAGVLDADAVKTRGGNPQAAFYVFFQPGTQMAPEPDAPLHGPAKYRGMHGFDPDNAAMDASFLIEGPGIPARRDLGAIDMRDVAPTLAKILGVDLHEAARPPLF